jgi:hypothetical protein
VELRGIGDVTRATDLKAGRFYRRQDYEGGTILIQAVAEKQADSEHLWALEFRPPTKGGMRLDEIYLHTMYVEIPNVHLRVDSLSFAGDELSTSLRAGMLIVSAGVPTLLAIPPRNFGYTAVELSEGRLAQSRPTEWACFNRWSLVADDGDDEIELFSYELPTGPPTAL